MRDPKSGDGDRMLVVETNAKIRRAFLVLAEAEKYDLSGASRFPQHGSQGDPLPG